MKADFRTGNKGSLQPILQMVFLEPKGLPGSKSSPYNRKTQDFFNLYLSMDAASIVIHGSTIYSFQLYCDIGLLGFL
jgi:hypothetical protein